MYCKRCYYDLRGAHASLCPECDALFDHADPASYHDRPPSLWRRHPNLGAIVAAPGLGALHVGCCLGLTAVYMHLYPNMSSRQQWPAWCIIFGVAPVLAAAYCALFGRRISVLIAPFAIYVAEFVWLVLSNARGFPSAIERTLDGNYVYVLVVPLVVGAGTAAMGAQRRV
jgi:hypothetical protein